MMTLATLTNHQIRLAARPKGLPTRDGWRFTTEPVVGPDDGGVLIKTLAISLDPAMRGWMNEGKSYIPPVGIGEVMRAGGIGTVIASKNAAFAVGDTVACSPGTQEYCVSDGQGLQKLDPAMAPLSTALGILGMPGMTAYFGFLDLCQPKAGETVVVSGAAGAVGSYVGQIAKIKGCRVVGIAGGDDKVDYLTSELGFDAAFNYKTTSNYFAKLKELCPSGIDCYFDNVGGAISDAVFPLMNLYGRASICGQISQYNLEKPEMGPRLLSYLLVKQVRVEGFIVMRFAPRFREGVTQMAQWLKEGKLKYREQMMVGFESMPAAFIAMLEGKNTGKMLVKA